MKFPLLFVLLMKVSENSIYSVLFNIKKIAYYFEIEVGLISMLHHSDASTLTAIIIRNLFWHRCENMCYLVCGQVLPLEAVSFSPSLL